MNRQPSHLLWALAAVAWIRAQAAEPPAQLEEVIVTAGLREVAAAARPGGVSVLARATVEDAAVVHLEELLPLVPSLSWAGASSRPRYFLLRGVGELEQYQGAPNPSVGFLVDELDFSGIGMIASTFDVEQIEVLRGPQGTRYGANALGGLIKVKTRDPVAERSLLAEAGAGGDGLWSAGIAAGGPAPGAGGAWRAALHRAVADGYRDNVFLGRDDTNGRDETTARLRLRFAEPGAWRADAGLLHADFDNGYDAFAIDNSLRTLSDRPGRDAQRSDGVWADVAWTLPGGELRSVTAWAESDIEASFDGDWGNADSWGADGPYDFFSRTLRDRRTLSQDLRFSSAMDGAWSWLAGAWMLRLSENNRIADDGRYLDDAFVRTQDSRYRAQSVAAYGQLEWRPRSATTVAAGLRLEQRDADYADSDGFAFDPRDRMWGGELTVTRRLGEAHTIWAMLSRGFRAGGFNIGSAVPPERQQFGPEYLWSLEAGWKGRDPDGARAADFNLFYTRREHQQVATSFQLDPQDPLTFVFLTDNAARGEAWGAEAAASLAPVDALRLDASLSWMRSRYLDYRFGERDLDGRAFAHAPEWKLALAASWRHAAGWMARLDVAGESGFYFDASHDERADSRLLVGLRAGFEAARWSVHAWVRNLLDERYPVRGFFFGNEPPDFPNRLYLRWGDPRQAGLTLRCEF